MRRDLVFLFYQEYIKSKHGYNVYNEALKKYPDYNFPGRDTDMATKYILRDMKKAFAKEFGQRSWTQEVGDKLYQSIYDGIT